VMNPYADQLTFPDETTRLRRDHEKYLTLIDTIALLHQHQRPIKTMQHNGQTICYIEATREDIETANKLAHEVLGRSLDELAPQTRRLLLLIEAMVRDACGKLKVDRADYRFSRKHVRAYAHWSDFQVKVHMHKLEELEYVLVHRGGRGQSFVYELLYDGQGQDGQPFIMGLIDVAQLKCSYDPDKEHPKPKLEGSSSVQVARKELGSRSPKITRNRSNYSASAEVHEATRKNALLAKGR